MKSLIYLLVLLFSVQSVWSQMSVTQYSSEQQEIIQLSKKK